MSASIDGQAADTCDYWHMKWSGNETSSAAQPAV